MIQSFAQTALLENRVTLTVREQEIIQHIAKGAQNDGIAYEMGISTNTVKTHIGNILRKFGLHNRTQIAMLLTPHLVATVPASHVLAPRPAP